MATVVSVLALALLFLLGGTSRARATGLWLRPAAPAAVSAPIAPAALDTAGAIAANPPSP